MKMNKGLLALVAVGVAFAVSRKPAAEDPPPPEDCVLPPGNSFVTGAHISFALSNGASETQLAEISAAFGRTFEILSPAIQQLFCGFTAVAGFRNRVARTAMMAQDPTPEDFELIKQAMASPIHIDASRALGS